MTHKTSSPLQSASTLEELFAVDETISYHSPTLLARHLTRRFKELCEQATSAEQELLTHYHAQARDALEQGTLGQGITLTAPSNFEVGDILEISEHTLTLKAIITHQHDLLHAKAVLSSTHDTVDVMIATSSSQSPKLARAGDVLTRLFSDDAPQHKHLPRKIASGLLDSHGHQALILDSTPRTHPTLKHLLTTHPSLSDPEHVIWVLRRSLSVLGWAHKMGVVHGNVCPDVLRINASNHNVWLMDWTHAAIDPARTGQGFSFTNPDFSPPEVYERKPPLPSSDLYALGRTMQWLIKGGQTTMEPLPEHTPEELVRLLTFMTLASPTGRARDAWELYHEVERIRRHLYGQHQFKPLT